MMRATSSSRMVAVIALVLIWVAAPLFAQPAVTRELDETGTWTVTEQTPAGGADGELAAARQSLAEERYKDACKRIDRWLERYPNHDLAPEALLVRADALNLRKEYYKALFDYEAIAQAYPGSEAYTKALEREFDIAVLFTTGTRRKLWGFRWASAEEEGEELLIRIQERLPGSKLAEKAGRALADYYYRDRRMELATTAYDLYLENHPQAPDRPYAMQRLVYANLALFKGPKFDPSGLYEARAWLSQLKQRYPAEAQQAGADALNTRIDESDAEQMLVNANWYLDRRDGPSAKFVLERLLRRYPDTAAGREGYRLMVHHGWVEPPSDADSPDSQRERVIIDDPSESDAGGEDVVERSDQ